MVSALFAMGTLTFVSAWRWDCLQSFDLTRWRELLFRLRFKVQNQAESVLCTRVFTKTHSTSMEWFETHSLEGAVKRR